MYWLLVGLVRSLKPSHKEALRKPLLCEDYSGLTSPASNQIPDIPGPPEFRDSVIAEKIAVFSVFRGIHYFPWNL